VTDVARQKFDVQRVIEPELNNKKTLFVLKHMIASDIFLFVFHKTYREEMEVKFVKRYRNG